MPIFKNLYKGHEEVWDKNFYQNTLIDFETSQFAIFLLCISHKHATGQRFFFALTNNKIAFLKILKVTLNVKI